MAIYVSADEIWDFFYNNKKDLDTTYMLVAEDPKDKIEVYITIDCGFPFFRVEVDGEKEFTADCVSRVDTEIAYKSILQSFCIENDSGESDFSDDLDPVDDKSSEELMEDELVRIDELCYATRSLFETFTEMQIEDSGLDDGAIEDMASAIAEILYTDYGYATYFPTKTEDGVISYPYGGFDESEELD